MTPGQAEKLQVLIADYADCSCTAGNDQADCSDFKLLQKARHDLNNYIVSITTESNFGHLD